MVVLEHRYVVFDPSRADAQFLRTKEPFCYPEWVSADKATEMPFAKAHSFCNAYASPDAIVVSPARAAELALREAAASTLPNFGGWNFNGFTVAQVTSHGQVDGRDPGSE